VALVAGLIRLRAHAGGLALSVPVGWWWSAFFLSNPEELAKYQSRKWLVASAIVDAVTKG